ncbi:MAG: tetratricopeptide (TPR) repeat protein [Myxococcota bacterium]|jgi:tetratricopeptide (TPR) repeat protein
MRSWFASSVLCLVLFAPTPAAARSASDGQACLRSSDLTCAQDVREELLRRSPDADGTLRLVAQTAFHEGDYAAALEAWMVLQERGVADDPYTPYAATAAAATGLVEARTTGVMLRHDTGVDTILAEEGLETLAQARATYDALFGGGPDHEIVLDIFPTASRFTAASGLPPEAVQNTGVIALSKWNRLLLTSPRALSRGYNWKDTISHEYIHLVVSWRSGDRVPVWLQEGLAKHLEGDWRGGRAGYLSVHQQSLLAEALATDTFVPFEKFKQSMAYLDSGEEAALAFAQVATMVHFLLDRGTDVVLVELMDRIRSGEASEDVVADLAGFEDFAAFREGWKDFIAKLPLIEAKLSTLPVVLDGSGSDFSSDPLLSVRTDLAKFARLGDLLRDADRPAAALIEYEKAADPDAPPSPMLLARKAVCLQMMGELPLALAVAEEGVALYPEFPLLQVTVAQLREASGQKAAAITAWKSAHDLNPFNPTVQRALMEGYEATGQTDLAARHARYARILSTGGALD